LELAATAKAIGVLSAPALVLREGAQFEGSINADRHRQGQSQGQSQGQGQRSEPSPAQPAAQTAAQGQGKGKNQAGLRLADNKPVAQAG
jgi:cytoskeletal protein CcmA (bactofilin family)